MMKNRLEKVRLADIGLDDTTFMSRLDFDEGRIKSFAEDIRRFGQRNPIGLRENEGRLQIIYGWNRIKAFQLLGRDEIEARNYGDISDLEAQMHNIQDNLQREDLTTLEVAYQVKLLKEVHELHVEKIAEIYGVKKSTIYNLLSLTEMEDEIKQGVHLGNIELTHALKISRFPVSNRLEILRRTIDEELSVSQLDRILRGESEPRSAAEVMAQREFDRLRKFLMTQMASKEFFKLGTTRESQAEWYASVIEDHWRDGKRSLLTLIEFINDLMYSVISSRFFGSVERPWDTRVISDHLWLVNRGFRRDKPKGEAVSWLLYETTRYNAKHCNHKWVTEENAWRVGRFGEEKMYGHCENCAIDRAQVAEVAMREWRDPPYEAPPQRTPIDWKNP